MSLTSTLSSAFQVFMRLLVAITATFCFVTVLVAGLFAQRALQNKAPELKPRVGRAVRFSLSPPLSSMKPVTFEDENEGKDVQPDDRDGGVQPVNKLYDNDPIVQRWNGEGVFSNSKDVIPPVTTQFAGMTSSSQPPDTDGDVGPSHYVQMVNSRFQVFTKAGVSVFGPVNINTLWAGFGGACQTENAGDPVVLYDQIADRWLLTQFTSAGPTYFNCVALSQTSDPAGAYYRWAFTTGTNFPDYPKLGQWSDGYYIANREFTAAGPAAGAGVYALNRDQMLLGNASPQVVSFIFPAAPNAYLPGDGLLPADIDGKTLPPAGRPEFFVGSMDGGGPYGAPADALNLFKFTVNWAVPASSTFAFANQLNIAAYDTTFPCATGTNGPRLCIPQPGTTAKIDVLSYRQRPTFRLAYRNFGTYESLVTTQSVQAVAGVAGMRWWEIRSPNASPVIFQEGTYSPDSVNRWMGSIAQDRAGNMLLAYSVSDATSVFPGIRYTGRLAADALGTMPQGEATMVAGAGSQTNTNGRWGDYSQMTMDPIDDCTFWYTTMYYTATSSSTAATRIGSVKFPQCAAATAAGVTVSGRVLNAVGRGIFGATVRIQSMVSGLSRTSATTSRGRFSFDDIPVGDSYIVTVSTRKYSFSEPSRILNLQDAVSDFNFMANR